MATDARVNEKIRTPRVRLISDDGTQLGIKPTDEALRIAYDAGLDLVEVAPQADPPVCRIMDYGKYRYEQTQKMKRAKKHSATMMLKEMKLRPKIDSHDYEVKKKHIVRFLEDGAKVKVTIMFRGREMAHTDLGRKLLDRIVEEVSELGKVEAYPKLDGRNMIMVLAPIVKAVVPE
ncbi:MAG: translation initiation factor IF-3 [Candidatus Aquicultor secundus]|uniref:Translation initiation factor IF-3 n=1 Tax=Candidatus Aquicultor secundus TaxID=1973895 RepID=A0A2M7T5X4_9ACTN|nr:translation initiation factor IF-3 [Candidatus Aquicultor secundus]NCO66878.1 translation initiation factor IF-3 [Solirubrobacter sp.]PIU25983.1 MAG: translation initiation factor IF-3 [Candidatus Aquicultor secundus]PIW23247.1 MAG: translation initiation factor IF-3 [Candidatus Aquicultor secundus]PIX52060.1 MAG: translation initiation factor IF-3 [Candidatus Aquicultor secundus]PIY41513.1 MAG: translation initiation factor IF-3 [Candidatus Aquicultor secundus]